jgi:hypothetical protein
MKAPYQFEIHGFYVSCSDEVIQRLKETLKGANPTRATFGMRALVTFVGELDKLYAGMTLTNIPITVQDGWNTQPSEQPSGQPTDGTINSEDLQECLQDWDPATIDDASDNVSKFVKHRSQRQYKSDPILWAKNHQKYMESMKKGGFYGFAGFTPLGGLRHTLRVDNVRIIEACIEEMGAAFADRCIVQAAV